MVYSDIRNDPGTERLDVWFSRWEKAIRFAPCRYDLPGGAVGRRFVYLSSQEVKLVGDQKEHSEQMVVFRMLMLQKEPLINKNADIRWLLTKRMDMWENCDIDVSMSEAIRCNESSKIKRRMPQSKNKSMNIRPKSFTD